MERANENARTMQAPQEKKKRPMQISIFDRGEGGLDWIANYADAYFVQDSSDT
jgi:hypothetical protein